MRDTWSVSRISELNLIIGLKQITLGLAGLGCGQIIFDEWSTTAKYATPERPAMLAGLLVADDYTGGADTGSAFAARGYRTSIGQDAGKSEVLVVDTDSRTSRPDVAADRVSEAVAAHPADVVYKKVDSTLRGNIAAETSAAVNATGADIGIVAPAFPAQGRTTAAGIHYVDGVPLDQTEYATGDENPPTSSRLSTVLAPSEYPVESLELGTVAAGADAVSEQVQSVIEAHPEGVLLACDATHPHHLAQLAAGVVAASVDAVYVGSGGLAQHVQLSPQSAGVLGIAGSTSQTTLGQLQSLPEDTIIHVDSVAVIEESEAAISDAVAAARERVAAGQPAVITTATQPGDVSAALNAGSMAGLEEAETRDRIATALATVARRVIEAEGIGGLFLTGGTIARAVLETLAAARIELTGHTVAAGVPMGRLHGGIADETPVVTKAGGFGDQGTITTCLDQLARVR